MKGGEPQIKSNPEYPDIDGLRCVWYRYITYFGFSGLRNYSTAEYPTVDIQFT